MANFNFSGTDNSGQIWVNGVNTGRMDPSWNAAAASAAYVKQQAAQAQELMTLQSIVGNQPYQSGQALVGTGPNDDSGNPVQTTYNQTEFATLATAQAIAAMVPGAQVISGPLMEAGGGTPDSPFTMPDAYYIRMPDGGVVNAGLLASYVQAGRLDLFHGELAAAAPAQGAGNTYWYQQFGQSAAIPGPVIPGVGIPPPLGGSGEGRVIQGSEYLATGQGSTPTTGRAGVSTRTTAGTTTVTDLITAQRPGVFSPDPSATFGTGASRTQSNSTPTTVDPGSSNQGRGTGYGTLPAGTGTGAAQAAASNPPSPNAQRQYPAGDQIAPQILALAPSPNASLTADAWGYYFQQVTGTPAPAPEALGFTGEARTRPMQFGIWYAAYLAYHGGSTSSTTSGRLALMAALLLAAWFLMRS